MDADEAATGSSSNAADASDEAGRRAVSASGDNTSSVTTSIDPGKEAQNVTDMSAAAPAEAQTSVAGNQGFGKTGQQPDSIGDHPQVGTGAPVRGADGGGNDESEERAPSSAEQEKGAESVGVAS